MSLSRFHPVTARWFTRRFGAPTAPQAGGWPEISAGRDTLIAAPTGSGKTLAAFLWCLDDLVQRGLAGSLGEGCSVLYVSPLKALSNDISRNLEGPLKELREEAAATGLELPEVRVGVRTGDTDPSARARMAKNPPHILVTTPESLFILLTAKSGRAALSHVRTVIVDEIHAVAGSKRGAHLALSLERLDAVVEAEGRTAPQRIGLSATQKPIERIAALLTGARPLASIVDAGFARTLDLEILVPGDELSAVASHETMEELYDRIAALSEAHRSTLVFVNTRRLVERVAHHLAERLGEDRVAAHHGSLSRETRFEAEQKLKAGELRCVVATASLELGIDVGAVDLVVQVGSPRNIATFLQRVGRSGHSLGATPKGRLYALTRDQLLECAALIRSVRAGILDAIEVPPAPMDVLAQQVVAMCAAEEWTEDALYARVTRADPYRRLPRAELDRLIEMLAEGVVPDKGRSRAYLLRDAVNHVVKGRRGSGLTAMTSGGAIPDRADYAVIAGPEETFVGTVDEDFAVESMAGDIFLLGNTSWRVRRVEAGKVRVDDAHGAPPSVPFWRGEAPARTPELSDQVSLLREELEVRLERGEDDRTIATWLAGSSHMPLGAAEQAVAYLSAARAALGALPTKHTLIAERFFDEGGGMQLVIHAPLGGRLNKAWGLALRKRFCASFDFELQAAATDDAIVISLGPVHSFPLADVFDFLSPGTAREVLTQAILQSPIFTARWRWVAQRSLAVPRHTGSRRVPPPILRMRTDDLLAGVFPMAAACQDNITGPIVVPDHPLVAEALRDCLEEAVDLAGLEALLTRIKSKELRLVARDTAEPSVLAHEILNANPYAYLDDAPLEERRTRAVALRRGLPAQVASELGALDPAAIETADREARPAVRDADELHDALLGFGVWPEAADASWLAFFDTLVSAGRAVRAILGGGLVVWVARERQPLVQAAYRDVSFVPPLEPLPGSKVPASPEDAHKTIVRGHLESCGPRSATELAATLALEVFEVDQALLALEAEGAILRGSFTPRARSPEAVIEWCDRRILARIHRLTLGRLRREIEPVTPAEFQRFLLRWQHVAEGTELAGVQGTLQIIEQLQGIELAAGAWEREVLARRILGYEPGLLDAACLGGEVTWGRLVPRDAGDGSIVTRAAAISLVTRDALPWLIDALPDTPLVLTPVARKVQEVLAARGACFFRDLVSSTGEGTLDVQDALRELIFAGLVTADGFAGLRGLIASGGSGPRQDELRGGGRWSCLRQGVEPRSDVDAAARQLLLRWGVVFRDVVARESRTWLWRELLPVLRRMEARGEIRGGRFVSGFVGEQYALPDAVELLRAVRKQTGGELCVISAVDPLNLTGITSPGPKVPALAKNAIVYRDGVAIAAREGDALVVRVPLDPEERARVAALLGVKPERAHAPVSLVN